MAAGARQAGPGAPPGRCVSSGGNIYCQEKYLLPKSAVVRGAGQPGGGAAEQPRVPRRVQRQHRARGGRGQAVGQSPAPGSPRDQQGHDL